MSNYAEKKWKSVLRIENLPMILEYWQFEKDEIEAKEKLQEALNMVNEWTKQLPSNSMNEVNTH